MRVLLTGAAGFIGSHLARILVREGCDVQALVRPGSNLQRLVEVKTKLQLLLGDFLDPKALKDPIGAFKPEFCVHLAWFAEPGKYLSAEQNLELMSGTLKLASLLADVGCRRFVGVGTCFEYDTNAGYLSEHTRLDPMFLYAAAKAGTYLALRNLALGTMSTAWARLFYLYGPFEDERRLVPFVIRALLRGEAASCTAGEQVRDFLHVEDVASALWAIARSSVTDAVNIGSGAPVTVSSLVTSLGEMTGRPELVKLGALQYTKGDPPFICANNARLRSETSWQPRYSLRDGLLESIAWWRDRESSQSGRSLGNGAA